MRYLKSLPVILFCFIISTGCKKSKSTPPDAAPSGLEVNAVVSTDGSGNVAFTATATNAVSYLYEFGDGYVLTVATGITTYRYTLVGSNPFTVTVTATGSSGLTVKKSIQINVTKAVSLLWSEEFNTGGTPDPAKWGYDIGNGANGWGNSELQYYTDRSQNVIIANGVLKVTAIREAFSSSAFTSTRLLTKDKFSFKYGKVEVRAKLPAGVGTWPAIWMLGNNVNSAPWPACGEIDIMEHVGKNLNTIYGTLHYPGRSGGNGDGGTKVITNATGEFHTYTLDWSAAAIKIYVDDQLFHTVLNSAALPFNQEFFLIVNVAMGGNFGGPVDPAFTTGAMEVDYIRVYQ
jgi:beta-glucanase (GH16 family)